MHSYGCEKERSEIGFHKRTSYFCAKGEREEILFAYLYGSFARSEENEMSDIGIFLKDGEYEKFYPERLAGELEKLFSRDVYIIVLNGRNLVFLHQVLKSGELLFCRDEKKRVAFETDVYDKYLDIKYHLDIYNKMRKERILANSNS